jgi:glycosyltransferase involved in cell wall biosynthesis
MKLLLIHNKYQTNNIGGEDIVFVNELSLLRKALGAENVLSYEVSNDNIKTWRLIYEIWFSRKHYKNVKDIIETEGVDILHVHNFFPLLTPSVFKAGKDCDVKVVHTLHNYRLWCVSGIFYRDGYGACELCTNSKFSFHGILNKCYRKSMIQSILAQASFWFYQWTNVFANIDYFFVLTKFQKEKVRQMGIENQRVILKPNSLDMVHRRVENKKGYIYVGRLEESKGIYELLNTWSKLDDRYVLTVVGGGDIEAALRQQYSQKNIIFRGKRSREDTLEYISKSEYLIQPSLLYETFGLTIIEAMSLAVPVIGFDIGTRNNFIEDGVNGFLSGKNQLAEVVTKSFEYKYYDLLSANSLLTAGLYENSYIIKRQVDLYSQMIKSVV